MTSFETNILAVAGLVCDPGGNIVRPPRGPLNLAWLVPATAEQVRQARARLAKVDKVVEETTVWSWFCVASEADLMALAQLEQGAWRRALKTWQVDENSPDALVAVHNQATLHRLMYLNEESENRGAHLRKSAQLYQRLSTACPSRAVYSSMAAWLLTECEQALELAHKANDDDAVAKYLDSIAQSSGLMACEDVQERLLLAEIDDLALLTATIAKDLLPFQGVVHAAPHSLLASSERQVEDAVLPLATRLTFRLVSGSRQRRRVESLVAELCGLLGQSLFKAQEGGQGQKWQGLAQRWDQEVAAEWVVGGDEALLGDETAAPVSFPDPVQDDTVTPPRGLGFSWLGVRSSVIQRRENESREVWLESFRLLGVPLFPLRQFVVHHNLDTGELGQYRLLPLTGLQHLWQVVSLVLLSLGVLGSLAWVVPTFVDRSFGDSGTTTSPAERQAQIDTGLERLKALAVEEAELRRSAKPEAARLKAIESEREALVGKMQRLERSQSSGFWR